MTSTSVPVHDMPTGDLLRERYQQDAGRSPLLPAYYACKPLIPRRVQLSLRRRYAVRQAARSFPAWPIEPILVARRQQELRTHLQASGAERVPIVNPWPGRRRFAHVLTHDVEGPEGLANIERVREVERRHGCVSSWNFCAEWYPIPSGTFERLREEGCEVGLHGITHDGKLFQSRARFEADLPKIHAYMRAWGASGFRSPATHRRADWMPELGCLYDSSFPDTDPFEPQGGGCCSIFPFMLGELVELPITLVQDHTLMEILRRPTIDLWTEKAGWIARHNGLVNLITHPDYLDTPQRLAMYEEFIEFLGAQDGGWHALPLQVAAWWREYEGLAVEESRNGVPLLVGRHGGHATIGWASLRDGALAIEA